MLWRPLREGIAKICAPPKSYYPRMITSETCTRGAPPGTAERDTTALRGFTRRDTFTQSQRAQSQRAKRGQKRDKFFSTLFSLSLVSLRESLSGLSTRDRLGSAYTRPSLSSQATVGSASRLTCPQVQGPLYSHRAQRSEPRPGPTQPRATRATRTSRRALANSWERRACVTLSVQRAIAAI